MSMNEVIPNLWIGDLPSALNAENLKAHNIRSVLTAMRGRVSINETFVRHQINIDDTENSDILQHFVPAITFIQAELDKEHGILVHCQAGMSRSVSIVAAYLMVSQGSDPDGALDVIRKVRPEVQPNEGFMRQLEIFHKASFKVSKSDKETRMFYLERVVNEVMNGDGEVETEMFAKFPYTPSDTPVPTPRRRIRCKMCRQELATREHMLDHGQLGPPTPAVLSAASSRRPSMNDTKPLSPLASGVPTARRASSSSTKPSIQPPPLSPSGSTSRRPSMHDLLPRSRLGSITENRPLKSSLLALDSVSAQIGQNASDALSDSALEEDSSGEEPPESDDADAEEDDLAQPSASSATPTSRGAVTAPSTKIAPPLAQRPSMPGPNTYVHPSDLAAQLSSHPKLAGLRAPAGLAMTPANNGPPAARSSPQSPGLANARNPNYFAPVSPPILINPKCSGYFVEPMKWMEPILEQGHMAGKIMCPNKKCNAKLGNYDWAGVCCSCKEWVVPGFCIHRSKVDEVV
ncbi:hypothetical protein C8Q79DRAFT_982660 [Trametes meyenii]|nr:hypothetical protein C8Q79DRAFT_982660 [Trametes meyenii]